MVLAGTGMRFVLSRTYREFCERAAAPTADGTAVSAMLPESFKKGYEPAAGSEQRGFTCRPVRSSTV